jgi:type IV secretion system protein VirB9
VRVRALTLAVIAAFAQQGLAAAPPDARVQLLPYESDQVVPLAVAPGYAAVVELAPDEAIQNVVVGNSAVWQVTANSSSDRIIVKPLGDATTTNMIVITDARRYVFLLEPQGGASGSPGAGGEGLFVLRFTYPASAAPAKAAAAAPATYRLAGARNLFPSAMRDDGQRTTITWPDKAALPAVFALEEGGKEAIVNGRMMDGDYVIEGTASKYVFRMGDVRAIASRHVIKARK